MLVITGHCDLNKMTFSQVENPANVSEYQQVVFQCCIVQSQINERLRLSLLMIHQNGEMCQLAM